MKRQARVAVGLPCLWVLPLLGSAAALDADPGSIATETCKKSIGEQRTTACSKGQDCVARDVSDGDSTAWLQTRRQGGELRMAKREEFWESSSAPPNISRETTLYESCDLVGDTSSVTFFPTGNQSYQVTAPLLTIKYVKYGFAVHSISWKCTGMAEFQTVPVAVNSDEYVSVQLYEVSNTGSILAAADVKQVGQVRLNTYRPTTYRTSLFFVQGTEGYFCYKIPSILRTQSGALLAFAEARKPNCSDYARTDLVYKRSTDGGLTWSPLALLSSIQGPGLCGASEVVGQAVPVQLSASSKLHPGRILVPYVRNNFQAYVIHSDDDGVTFTGDREVPDIFLTDPLGPDCGRTLDYFGIDLTSLSGVLEFFSSVCFFDKGPYFEKKWRDKLVGPWQFVGLGPPGSVQLSNGRVLAPGYHSYVRGSDDSVLTTIAQLYNNFALGHVLISDDDGDSWSLGSASGFGKGLGEGANEDQMAQLANGSVVVESRSLATGSPQFRVQARSDDAGATFTPTGLVKDLPQVFNGVEGSLVHGDGSTLYLSQPDPSPPRSPVQSLLDLIGCKARLNTRERMTIFKSADGGGTYPQKTLIDPGFAGYSSMDLKDDTIFLLYEQVDPVPQGDFLAALGDKLTGDVVAQNLVQLPTRFVFRAVPAKEL